MTTVDAATTQGGVEGPDVIRLLSDLGVNTFGNAAVNKAKQFVACNHDGYVIGDGILFSLDENRVSLVGGPSAHNWVQYHAETGGLRRTLAWNGEDVARAMGSMFEQGDPVKYIDFPLSNYATWPYDKVLRDDDLVGISSFSGYSYNERSFLSLAMVDVDVEVGTEVTLVWGEAGGGSSKPVVERHRKAVIRAIVSPCPYSEVVRSTYHEGWRSKAGVA